LGKNERSVPPLDDLPVVDRPDALEAEDIVEVHRLQHRPVQIPRPQRRLHESPFIYGQVAVDRFRNQNYR